MIIIFLVLIINNDTTFVRIVELEATHILSQARIGVS